MPPEWRGAPDSSQPVASAASNMPIQASRPGPSQAQRRPISRAMAARPVSASTDTVVESAQSRPVTAYQPATTPAPPAAAASNSTRRKRPARASPSATANAISGPWNCCHWARCVGMRAG